jgi:protein-disulfide isomerase
MAMLKPKFDGEKDHYSGPLAACVELVEYGDFQCRHCAEVYPVIKFLQEGMGDNLRFIFRHYPQPVLHRLSLDASVAAETAALQGKFWQMHDMIFENQKYLSRSRFLQFAEDIELDTRAYEDNREHKKMIQKVISDFEGGVKSGVEGTPTFFINGRRYNGFHDLEDLTRVCKFLLHTELAAP